MQGHIHLSIRLSLTLQIQNHEIYYIRYFPQLVNQIYPNPKNFDICVSQTCKRNWLIFYGNINHQLLLCNYWWINNLNLYHNTDYINNSKYWLLKSWFFLGIIFWKIDFPNLKTKIGLVYNQITETK